MVKMVKVDALARATSIGPWRQRESLQLVLVEFLAMALTDRGGNSDRLSSLWRDVISLRSAGSSFSSVVDSHYQHE
ncbi:hypothetical protein AB4853_41115 [Bradyrhizobium sp. 1050_B9_N1_2]|uniref:hypothetical protein n=1 Tax=Bradyrhizobium sp. 1050_B9_N1_2 TaxID=3238688 RepID=UPI003EDBFBBE